MFELSNGLSYPSFSGNKNHATPLIIYFVSSTLAFGSIFSIYTEKSWGRTLLLIAVCIIILIRLNKSFMTGRWSFIWIFCLRVNGWYGFPLYSHEHWWIHTCWSLISRYSFSSYESLRSTWTSFCSSFPLLSWMFSCACALFLDLLMFLKWSVTWLDLSLCHFSTFFIFSLWHSYHPLLK